MTLYRGQKTIHDGKPFVPSLLRNGAVQNLEASIKKETDISDLSVYKSLLSEYVASICPSLLHRELADKDHLYYFFLSLVNIGIKIQKNPVLESNDFGLISQFIRINKNKAFALPSPDDVRSYMSSILCIESAFDGSSLKDYSFFQHLNFIFPQEFPTLLLDWTSDKKIAEFFSKDVHGNLGTIVSIEYPNSLYPDLGHFSGPYMSIHEPLFLNAVGYACEHYNRGCENMNLNIGDGKNYFWQAQKFHFAFQQSLMALQQATCLYWPYRYTIQQLDDMPALQEALSFNIKYTKMNCKD
jgi:hypothetical protein